MSEQLQSCKLAINLIVGVATLYSSICNSHVMEEIKKTIATKQNKVKGAVTTAKKQLIVLENRVGEMNLSNNNEEVATPAEGKTKALQQLEEELKRVKASQKLLNELSSKSQEEAVVKATGSQSGSITVVFGNNSSGFSAGIINGGVSGISFGGK